MREWLTKEHVTFDELKKEVREQSKPQTNRTHYLASFDFGDHQRANLHLGEKY
jgi:hypothetical protein